MTDKRLKMPSFLCKFDLTYLLNTGDIAQNTIYLAKKNCTPPNDYLEWSDSDADAQADNIGTAWGATLGHVISQDATLESVAWTWNESLTDPLLHEGIANDSPFPVLPSVGSESFPAGIAVALRLQTGLGGRSRHGRIFLPAVPATFGTTDKADLLTNTAQTAYNTQGAAFLAMVNNNNCVLEVGVIFEWHVVSFIENGALRNTALNTPITAVNISDPFVDYQRRRSLGHARHH